MFERCESLSKAQSSPEEACASEEIIKGTRKSFKRFKKSVEGYGVFIQPRDIAPVLISTILPEVEITSAVFSSSSKYHDSVSSNISKFELNLRGRSG